MAIIKEYLINPIENNVLVEILVNNVDIAKVYCDTGGDGGQVFRDALLEYSGPVSSAMYFDGKNIINVGDKPTANHIFDYTTKQWYDPRTPETQWSTIRSKRNQLLQDTDWTQLADIPAETKNKWEPYRQALRDVTSQSDPFNIAWPLPPE